MRTWSLPIGRLFGVNVRIHFSFVVLWLFLSIRRAAVPGESGVERALALTLIVLASVALREIARALATLGRRPQPRALILLPIIGVPVYDEVLPDGTDPRGGWLATLAGPLANLLAAFVAASIVIGLIPEAQLFAQPWIYPANLLRSTVWLNVFLAALNLVPAYPLDAGRLVRTALARRMDPLRATRAAAMFGQMVAMLFLLGGLWNTWLMLVGLFLFMAAQIEERTAAFHSVLSSVRMEEVMLTDFATLSPSDTLEDAMQKAVHTLQDDFPVVRGSDLVGVISRQRIADALRSGGNGYVQAAMNRIFQVAQRTESLASAFRKVNPRITTVIPIVDNQRLVGIVTLQNLMHSMTVMAQNRRSKTV